MKTKSITTPLAAVIAAASRQLPTTTGATAAADRLRNRPPCCVVLADVSGSMAEPAGHRRKIDVLSESLQAVPPNHHIVAFASTVKPIRRPSPLPTPDGSTALHLALHHCIDIGATQILVISDGHPDDPRAALAAADAAHSRIDIIYCGPESDRDGMEFMRRLARGGGSAHRHSLGDAPQMIEAVRRLSLPKPME